MIKILEKLTEAIVASGIDVAPTYEEYMSMAFGIANDCGEQGRTAFHRICTLSAKYDREHADRLFDNALAGGEGKNSLGTLWHLARAKGINTKGVHERDLKSCKVAVASSPSHAYTREGAEGDDDRRLTDDDERSHAETDFTHPGLDNFTDYQWPRFLQQMVDCGTTPAQRDILLLGSLTVLGASLNRLLCFKYGHRLLHPCLQTFVVAPPASGKGALGWTRHLAEPIHNELLDNFTARMKKYRKEKNAWDTLGKEKVKHEEPEMPKLRTFLIAGDNSGTGILENLMDNNGVGLICESEADTVSTAIGADYGHWSDTLRKCFEHDRLAYNRRTNHEYRECKKSLLSVLLSGTPAQVRPLIPSSENGLFSRQLFYFMPAIDEWADQLGEEEDENDVPDFDSLFEQWGEEWKKQVDELRRTTSRIRLWLSSKQKRRINTTFARLFSHAGATRQGDMKSTVARMAINAMRMMCVVAFLRSAEMPALLAPENHVPKENVTDGTVSSFRLTICDTDFEAVISLATVLYRHACFILSFLPQSEVIKREVSPLERLFDILPLKFTTRQAHEEARKLQIPEGSVKSAIKRMTDQGKLNQTERGTYEFRARVRV